MTSVISPGGQVYDRTTGEWVGANQGSVGDGIDRSSTGDGAKVWRDANGIVGVQFVKATPGGVANRQVTTGKGGSGGGGPGSGAVLGTVWWEEAGDLGPVAGSLVRTSALPPLQPVMKATNTAFQIGGMPFVPNPGTSNAEEMEALLGDGDSPLEISWYFKQAAALSHVAHNFDLSSQWANQKWLGGKALGADWLDDARARVTAPVPAQEPVDWGR